MEQTLVFIKPDGVKRGLVGRILQRFEDRGLVLVQLKLLQLNDALCDAHYAEHVDKPFYPSLKAYVTSGPVAVFVVAGENVVKIVRKMVGVTDAAEAESGTIRGDFALSKGENIIHASDSVDSAQREIRNFFGN